VPASKHHLPLSERMTRRGILFLVSAPSGAGKSTILNSLRPDEDLAYSISCTTRAPRPGEIPGEDYHFVSRQEFAGFIEKDELLEHAEVHGQYYGTCREPVLANLRRGVDVIMDLDVQGARHMRNLDHEIRDALVDIFLLPPSLDELRHRLIKRGTESPAQVETRLANAAAEMENWREYRYTLISGSMEEDLLKFRSIMRAERYLTRRLLLA
jgi:guanylate kinase